MEALEKELGSLLRGDSLRARIDNWKGNDAGLTAAEMAAGVLGVRELDEENPGHSVVFEAIANDADLPINWDELLELWIATRNRKKARVLSDESIKSAKTAIDQILPYGQPTTLTRQDVQRFIDEHKGKPTTVQTRCRMLSALIEVGIRKERIDSNVFTKLEFAAEPKVEDSRQAFTDDMLRTLRKENSPVFWLCLTGLRPGEYASRRPKDIEDGIVSITDEKDLNWRTKNIASIRRVPIPAGFTLMKEGLKVSTAMDYMQAEVKRLFNSSKVSPHSGRHTLYELSRRAGCDPLVVEAFTGHAAKRQSSQYGSFPDAVLIREAQKVWGFVDQITG